MVPNAGIRILGILKTQEVNTVSDGTFWGYEC